MSRQIFLAVSLGVSLVVLLWSASLATAASPTVTINPNPTAGYTTAQVSGEVTPGTEEVQLYAEFRIAGSAESWSERRVEAIAANAGPTPVAYEIENLKSETEYEFRLDAFVAGQVYLSPEPNPTATTKALAAPTVSIEPVTTFTAATAHFSAHINPNAPEAAPASPTVETAFAVHYRFECTPECPGLEGTVAADNTAHLIEVDATGLLPGVAYAVTLVGENAGHQATRRTAGPVSFTTPPAPPEITLPHVLTINSTEALTSGKVDPRGAPTTYRFEYGLTSAYEHSTPESEPIGSDNTEHEVSATLTGLAPGTTYHWRIAAENSAGVSDGPDSTFTTFLAAPAFALPDGRAYEQVSPVDKEGLSVEGERAVVHAAPDGNSLGFYTISTLPGSEGAQNYGVYLSSRGAGSWSTQGLLPPASVGRRGEVLSWSEDLAESYVYSNKRGGGSLYFARDSTTHALTEIGQVRNNSFRPIATTSTDSLLLFQSGQLLPDAAPAENVYIRQKSTGDIKLVGVLNSGDAPLGGSSSPDEEWHHSLASDGADAYFTDAETGQIYLRRNPAAAQSQLSGGACTEPAAACTLAVSASRRATSDPNGPKRPKFLTAASEGQSVAYFTSAEKLTNDATTGPADEGDDLYRYEGDGNKLVDLVPDGTDPNGAEVQGALGASADGSSIYFVANGVLGDGAVHGAVQGDCQLSPTGECNLYLWSAVDGIRYIARLSDSDSRDWLNGLFELLTPRTARVSANGTAVFSSRNQLTDRDSEGVPEFYRYSEASGQLLCVTCTPGGAVANPSGPSLYSLTTVQPSNFRAGYETHNLSSDGERFIFESGDKLVPEDTNGDGGCPAVQLYPGTVPRCQDVYEWEAPSAGSCPASSNGGCVFLISTGTSTEPAYLADADTTGANAFFYTGQPLVAQDKDQLVDIYDARIGGGLAAQNQVAPTPCADAACRGPSSTPPGEVNPGSSTFSVSESSKNPKRSCRKGRHVQRRNGKAVCTRKQHRKSHGSPKRSHHGRGGSK